MAYYEALKEEFDGDLTQIAAARIENNPRQHGICCCNGGAHGGAMNGDVEQPDEILRAINSIDACIYIYIYTYIYSLMWVIITIIKHPQITNT